MIFLKNNKFLSFLVLAVFVAGVSLVIISQKVHDTQRKVRKMDRKSLVTEWDIRTLRAELAYLTRPDRLDEISSAFSKSISPTVIKKISIVSKVSFSSNKTVSNTPVIPNRKPTILMRSSTQDSKPKNDFLSLIKNIGGDE